MSSEISSITSSAELSSDEEYLISGERGRGRGCGRKRGSQEGIRGVRGSRGRGKGRGRSREGRTQGPTRDGVALGEINRRTYALQEDIAEMELVELRQLCCMMAERHLPLVHDILRPANQQGGYHPQPGGDLPDWCVCGKCRKMPSDSEKVCCGKERCITLLPDCSVLVLDKAVLALGRMYEGIFWSSMMMQIRTKPTDIKSTGSTSC